MYRTLAESTRPRSGATRFPIGAIVRPKPLVIKPKGARALDVTDWRRRWRPWLNFANAAKHCLPTS
jgi:hypothetical protein